MNRFAESLAMRQPKLLTTRAADAGSGREQNDVAESTVPSDGSVKSLRLHPDMRTGLLMISQELWGTVPEQHGREMGRVGAWVWGIQCMLFQVFRFYASRSSNSAGVVLGAEDWKRFVEDCHIRSPAEPSGANGKQKDGKRKGSTALHELQGRAVSVFDHFKQHEAKKQGKNRTTNPAEDYALTFFEFLLAVVELSGRVVAAGLSSSSDMLLSQRVSQFLEQHIVHYVPRSDSAALETAIDSPSVRHFFIERKKELRNVFAVFCKADEADLNSLDAINQSEFREDICNSAPIN